MVCTLINSGSIIYAPVNISGAEKETVKSFMFLAIKITNNVFWIKPSEATAKRVDQGLYLLRRLKKFSSNDSHQLPQIRCRKMSVCITAWFEISCAHDHKELKRVVDVA